MNFRGDKNKIVDLLSIIIMFIGTSLLPNFISNLLGNRINENILSAIVAVVILIILYLVKKVLQNSNEQNFESSSADFSALYGRKFTTIRLYSINSRYWVGQFKDYDISAERCSILVRKHMDNLGDKSRYEKDSDDAMTIWKRLHTEGKIKELKIYEYDHLSDNYYMILDDQALIVGLNNFSKADSTGQDGSRKPRFITASSRSNSEEIKAYIEHFDNYVKYYRKNTKFDSNQDTDL